MAARSIPPQSPPVARTGIEGLDDVLAGGFLPGRMYLVEGAPGAGKTTLAMQFLIEGVRRGEPVLYITLSETEDELVGAAASHGWTLEGIAIRQFVHPMEVLRAEEQYTMYHPSDVELTETTKAIVDAVDALAPTRVIIDSLAELRLMAGTPLRFRRQILALKQYFSGRQATILVLDDRSIEDSDAQLHSIVHGVVQLEQLHPEYGSERRRLRVLKYRGVRYRGGYHDYAIHRGGLSVYPRLVAAEHREHRERRVVKSGVAGIDAILGGGLESGTSTLIVGAAGTGKSSLATQFVCTAANEGRRSAMYIFDEGLDTLLGRADGLEMPLRQHRDEGRVRIQQVDPAELSPGEFADNIRTAVDRDEVSMVVIDSLSGYLNAMPEERFLTIQLHELLAFLAQRGVATLLVSVQQGLIGPNTHSTVDASYLADGVMMIRYFETQGEVRQAISVIKKRAGRHERTIRELRLEPGGIRVGEPLRGFRGVLSGMPVPTTENGGPGLMGPSAR
jgi:circadian clock protein KaiC